MKLLIVGDIHIRGDNPRNRIGNYFEDCKEKLNEVFEIAEKENATIIQVGDFFNSPSTSLGIISDVASFLRAKLNRIYCLAGNHDIFAHNLNTLDRTPLGLLYKLNFLYPLEKINVIAERNNLEIIAKDFDFKIDNDYSEYITPEHPGKTQILVVHGMLLEKTAPFKHSLMEEVAKRTNADVIISGHYHLPSIRDRGGKLFINPGALMRMSATEEEITRIPQVVILDTNTLSTESIPLECAKRGNDVLDRSSIEINNEREENMALFISSLENTGEQKFMNLQEMMEKIASQDNLDALIIKEAIERLSKVREGTSK